MCQPYMQELAMRGLVQFTEGGRYVLTDVGREFLNTLEAQKLPEILGIKLPNEVLDDG